MLINAVDSSLQFHSLSLHAVKKEDKFSAEAVLQQNESDQTTLSPLSDPIISNMYSNEFLTQSSSNRLKSSISKGSFHGSTDGDNRDSTINGSDLEKKQFNEMMIITSIDPADKRSKDELLLVKKQSLKEQHERKKFELMQKSLERR